MHFLSLIMMAALLMSKADATYAAGDPEAGRLKAATCNGCHGQNSSNPMAPRLAGQPASYIIQEILSFKNGMRKDPVMSAMVIPLASDQDIEDIAAYYAGLTHRIKVPKRLSAALKMGERLYINKCEMCHGRYGRGRKVDELAAIVGVEVAKKTIGVPIVGGQPKSYLTKALTQFKAGIRKSTHEIGMDIVLKRTTKEQIALVARYLSSLSGKKPAPNPAISLN